MNYLLHILLFIRYRLFLFCCCYLLFASCDNEGYLHPIIPQQEKETQRILIAYLAGDNSLSPEIEQKIAALTIGLWQLTVRKTDFLSTVIAKIHHHN